jgi:NAD(P)-dependent dehydrogenase (short-subunit alcohol dehydrogenase family)
VISTAGEAAFKPLADRANADFDLSLRSKLMGQANLVRLGMASVADGGSFTLTSGVLAQEPMRGAAAVSMVNAGIEGFARSAALELPRGQRLNVVSPPWLAETLAAMGQNAAGALPVAELAPFYVAGVEGTQTGTVIHAKR